MESITVDKQELIDIICANRALHREKFERALEAFRGRVIAELNQRLDDVKAGRDVSLTIRLPVPEDHTGDYDTAIKMMNLHIGDTIQLEQYDVEKFVMDEWGWKERFSTTNTAYGVH